MITFIAISVSFIGGVYVGARYSDRLKDIWDSIVG
jgi:hypothetical protein